MLAGLYTDKEKTIVVEPGIARDHTERMFKKFDEIVIHENDETDNEIEKLK
jgi:5-enolpyruvylshikimate-3-phosphate synthase